MKSYFILSPHSELGPETQSGSGSQNEPLPPLTHAVAFTCRTDRGTSASAGISARSTTWRWLALRPDRAPERPANQRWQSVLSWGITPLFQLRKAANATPALAHLKSCGQPLSISLQPLIGAQRVLVMLPQSAKGGGLARFNAVINPFPFPARCGESGLPDQLQMVGQSGLAHLQRIRQLAHAHISRTQNREDSHARRIGKGFGKQNQVVHL